MKNNSYCPLTYKHELLNTNTDTLTSVFNGGHVDSNEWKVICDIYLFAALKALLRDLFCFCFIFISKKELFCCFDTVCVYVCVYIYIY